MTIPEPLTHTLGFKYYSELPPTARVATTDDFSNIAACIKKQKAYLIHSWHYPNYECHRCKPGFIVEQIKPWLDAGRVYVFEEVKKEVVKSDESLTLFI